MPAKRSNAASGLKCQTSGCAALFNEVVNMPTPRRWSGGETFDE